MAQAKMKEPELSVNGKDESTRQLYAYLIRLPRHPSFRKPLSKRELYK